MALKGIGKEIRRCIALIPGTSRRCKAWAVLHTNYCNKHTSLEVIDDREQELKRLLPLAYKQKNFLCRCSAYTNFPHHPGKGHCNWPDPPDRKYVFPPDTWTGIGDVEQKVKAWLRSQGVHNKNTGYAHTVLKARTIPLTSDELKPEDYTLLENYLKDYVELEDWSSLPIEEKRRRMKEQTVEALKKEYGFKQCLSGSENNTPRELRSKTVKDKSGKWFMVLENGERIPLE